METRDIAALPVIDLPGGWETVLEGPARTVLEREVLPSFLQQQRWFGGKARGFESVRLIDQRNLAAGKTPAFLVLLEVQFSDAATDHYFLPLGVTTEPAATALLASQRSRVLARLHARGAEAILHDALADADACRALLDGIGAGREWPTQSGRIRAIATAAFAELRGHANVLLPVEHGPETSSNSLVFFDRRLLLKLFRRLEAGINPDVEVGCFLTENGRFPRIPKVAGTIEYHRPGFDPVSLAILQEQVANQGDGWSHALAELARYFERAASRDPLPLGAAGQNAVGRPSLAVRTTKEGRPTQADTAPPAAIQERLGSYLQTAATLGRRTAELHLALAGATQDPAFTPEPLTVADIGSLVAEIQKLGRQALSTLRDHATTLPGEVGAEARRLLAEGPGWLEQLGQTPALPSGAVKIRCHGDYHLGQVLRVDNDFVILDFEGEPSRTIAERRAKQSPLKDVAGMLRSFDYAAYAGLFAFSRDRPDDFARLEPWAERWRQGTSAAFLRAYCATAGRAVFLPADGATLLDLFILDKAFYELLYELNNRPDWVRIPLRGVLALLRSA